MFQLFFLLKRSNNYNHILTSKENDNLKIQLFKNFSSRAIVLDFTNLIFQDIMSENLGEIDYTEEEYLNHVLKNKKWNVSVEQLKIAIRQNLNQPIPGTMEIIKELKEGKYQLILLSDHAREWMKYIEENNKDLEIFDKKIFSYDIGAVKSDEQTFKIVLEQAGIVADETLFIDDYEKNAKNAEEVGIHGIVFENAEQLRKILSSEYHLL